MDSDAKSHDCVCLINATTAADLLPHMLERFRLGYQDPLIFGHTTAPEAVVLPYALWRTHIADHG